MADTLESWAKKGLFKPDELKWSGVIPYLREHGGTVTRQDVLDYLKGNQVEVRVVEKGEKTAYPATHPTYDEWLKENSEGTHNQYQDSVDRWQRGKAPDTKFKDYMRLPAGLTNYREVLLTLPLESPKGWTIREVSDPLAEASGKPGTKMWEAIDSNGLQRFTADTKDALIAHVSGFGENFRVSGVHAYGDQAADVNRFAHMFLTDAEINGKKYLVVTELQSDWAQKGRKEGYAGDETLPLELP